MSQSPISVLGSDPRFRVHGTLAVWAEGRMVRYRGMGPFNLEFLLALDRADRQLLTELAASGPFGLLVEIGGSVMAPPDALAALEASLADQNEAGIRPVGVAFAIDPKVEGALLMQRIFARIFERQGIAFAWFDTLEAAQHWLGARLP
ncbi:hypothetical protein ACTSKR_07365 [Chitinibacteraceae bacterium HSL-7]